MGSGNKDVDPDRPNAGRAERLQRREHQRRTHWIGGGNAGTQHTEGYNHTRCGIAAEPTKESGVFKTSDGHLIAASYKSWKGVECRRCLRTKKKTEK